MAKVIKVAAKWENAIPITKLLPNLINLEEEGGDYAFELMMNLRKTRNFLALEEEKPEDKDLVKLPITILLKWEDKEGIKVPDF